MSQGRFVTGYLGDAEKLADAGYYVVSIAMKHPSVKLPHEPAFAPTMEMLTSGDDETYRNSLIDQALKYGIKNVLQKYPGKTAFVCGVPAKQWCHRRLIAELIEQEICEPVHEFGFDTYPSVYELLEEKAKTDRVLRV